MSAYTTDTKIKLQNKTSSIEVDLYGGAITDFHLHENFVNPLSFQFSKEQMPQSNKSGAVYQGHFLCAGRWGEPSAGEIGVGIPNHGEPANIEWQLNSAEEKILIIETTAHLEGLHVHRIMKLHETASLCHITELITNINPLGRLYNVVQHPTIATPFLNETTIINCNATIGFDYECGNDFAKHGVQWPFVKDVGDEVYDLRTSQHHRNSVFSFIVNPEDNYGWITAYSSTHNLVLGYIWQRKDYPWINLWQHFENGVIKYRGLEFGTTGLHQPFKKIIENNNLKVFNEPTVAYIDAGQQITKDYAIFLMPVSKNFQGVEKTEIKNGILSVIECNSNQKIIAGNTSFSAP